MSATKTANAETVPDIASFRLGEYKQDVIDWKKKNPRAPLSEFFRALLADWKKRGKKDL